MSPDRTLYIGAQLAAIGGGDPSHRAILVAGDVITWTGADPRTAPPHDRVVDLGPAWLTPAFVDAHVHATATGLQVTGIDLTGMGSAAQVLKAVQDHAARTDHLVVYGAGWDDLRWDHRPTAAELAAAAPGRTVVLVRVDGHSSMVDSTTLQRVDLRGVDEDVDRDRHGEPTGWLREQANARAQTVMWADLTLDQLAAARTAMCDLVLARGVTTFHEMGVPGLSDRRDAIAWATQDWPVTVHAWWADLREPLDGSPLRPGGDLFLDGSIGSCTAATNRPYPCPGGMPTTGTLFHDDDAVATFFTTATRAGVGAGVHAIGDRAVDQAIRALRAAADACGADAVRAARHRIEHVELVTADHVSAMAELGVTASMQPAFDATWNDAGGLYEQRFGREAADASNPVGWFAAAGVPLCFSSDSPVTPIDPWGGILAAEHHLGGHGIDRATALHAATLGGHRAAAADDVVGPLRPGMRADFVAWPGDPLTDDPRGWMPLAVVARGMLDPQI